MHPQPSDRHNRTSYARARRLRRPLTPTEAILWRELRNRRATGFKFRRQQPVGPYIADFFCPAAKLIVELDGETHVGREVKDARRQAYLEAAGYRVLRFWNTTVFDGLDTVLEAIWAACAARASGSSPSRGSPPLLLRRSGTQEGEGGRAGAAREPGEGTVCRPTSTPHPSC